MNKNKPACFINVDKQNKVFRLSTPVFNENEAVRWPKWAVQFFSSKKPQTFYLNGHSIFFREEIPFNWGPQPTLRHQIYRFMQRAAQAKKKLSDIARQEHIYNMFSNKD